MGNVCSSGQKKKDGDNTSEKSEDSPSYQLAEKKVTKLSKIDDKEAPLADPEQISDLSAGGHNISLAANSPTNGNLIKGSAQTKIQSYISDSVSSTPLTVNPPCELPVITKFPSNLSILQGKPITNRRTEKDRKIIVYILSTDNGNNNEKTVLQSIYTNLKERCENRGFEFIISDTHNSITTTTSSTITDVLDVRKWSESPIESQGGHDEAANCLAEITRHSYFSYIIPVLFLGTNLGTPLLPLTIESQDFQTALNSTENIFKRQLIEKWYILDSIAQPACYRLNTKLAINNSNNINLDQLNIELNELLALMVEIFTKELRDSYLTTVVEQEINNTVLINQELLKRCIWIQTGSQPPKLNDNPNDLEIEMNRRLINIQNDLKNQLPEKNLIRIPPSIQVQDDQLAAIMESLINTVIDGITDEHTNKYLIPNCTYGVDKRLLDEIEQVSQYSKILGQNCANFAIMDQIQNYITGTSPVPLVIYGATGSGKSVLASKIMHTVHSLIPESNLIIRYVNLTALSSHMISLVGSIAEQLSVITNNQSCRVNHSLATYIDFIKTTLESAKQYILIVIDSLDEINGMHNNIDWLPEKLPTYVKIIFTLTAINKIDNTENNWLLNELYNIKKIPNDNFIELKNFSDEQWCNVLSYGGGDFYASNVSLQLPENWRLTNEKTPLQAKILWWLAWLGNFDIIDINTDLIIIRFFEIIELKFNKNITEFLISLIIASNDGILEKDLIELFEESKLVQDSVSSKIWFKFCWLMGPMILHRNQITLMDKKIRLVACQRYKKKIIEAHKILFNHYTKQNLIYSDKKGKYKCYNVQKFLKLPYQAFIIDDQQQTKSFLNSIYLNDLQWIHDKLIATGCVQILSDLSLGEKYCNKNGILFEEQIHLIKLKEFLEKHMRELNYDGDQFYTLFNSYIQNLVKSEPNLDKNDSKQKWQQFLINVKSTYLERLNEFIKLEEDTIINLSNTDLTKKSSSSSKQCFDVITNLNGKGHFVASISTEREEICVWDVPNCKPVRILNGVPQPTSLCPVGEYGAAVLCRREIKVIDLDEGKFKVTLKGVMNQKMPYFGLHDDKHLVCLSRNRMYVNLMNLESGDCITTFKAGEDRFLNSLLVSGDGRILVCGDETQKPFPLLVWHLTQRKLLYDLRIPHHDFITSLSAITHEGSYVCVVAKELNEPTPNFIVVYDLQSGTLFKKWKPSCNTVSIAISQTNACVIAGLEDSRILIWDLVTGNCRCTLQGHNAPVTLLKLDPLGKILLSGDKEGRDMSVRLWELDTGKSLAVYTPPAKITTCEILPNGRYIILALENHSNLITLILRNYHETNRFDDDIIYGNQENEGKTFDLK